MGNSHKNPKLSNKKVEHFHLICLSVILFVVPQFRLFLCVLSLVKTNIFALKNIKIDLAFYVPRKAIKPRRALQAKYGRLALLYIWDNYASKDIKTLRVIPCRMNRHLTGKTWLPTGFTSSGLPFSGYIPGHNSSCLGTLHWENSGKIILKILPSATLHVMFHVMLVILAKK